MTREDAKAFMRKAWRETTKGSYAEEAYEMAIKALEQPTIEPERAKGEWLADTNEFDEWYCCSVCHKGLTMFDGTYDFCPNCGADMRGE
mgnify:CR=1 FL=1